MTTSIFEKKILLKYQQLPGTLFQLKPNFVITSKINDKILGVLSIEKQSPLLQFYHV